MYDPANRIASITYPSGTAVTYTRDTMGRITTVSAKPSGGSSTPVASSIAYEPFGPDTGFRYGSGSSETRGFDQDYRLTNVTDLGAVRRGLARVLENLSYAYYPTNNVQTITDAVTSGNSQSFSYDNLQRLSGASGGYGSFAFTYDHDGNRLSQTVGSTTTNYGYGTENDLLATLSVGGVTTQTFGYTADGRIASLTPGIEAPGGQYITSLSYNQDAQLSAVNAAGGALASYTYDGFGQRLIKTVSASYGEIYQYGQNGMLLEETNASGVAQADYIYLNGRPIATLDPTSGTIYFLHDDLLGTPQLATDSSQNTAWQATYQPFGQASVSGTITQNLRFPGQHFDLENGWNHNGFRNYLPDLGRFAEPDPYAMLGSSSRFDATVGRFFSNDAITDGSSISPYVYAENLPTTFTDPFGLQSPGLVKGPHTTQQMEDAFNEGLTEALKRLNNPDCRKAFCNKKGLDPVDVLKNTEYRFLPLGNGVGASTNPGESVFINTQGPFLLNNTTLYFPSDNPFSNTNRMVNFLTTANMRALILLHELGHEVGNFPPDQFRFINGSHTLKVLRACFKDLRYD